MEREQMDFDLLIVGGGPAGLCAAIRAKQLALEAEVDFSVCVIEKGSEIGAHILSGAVIDPLALNELIPDWKERGAPLNTPVTENHHWFLTKKRAIRFPHFLLPPLMGNKGSYTLSLGNLCRWLASQAEELGVEIYAGFAGAEVLYDEDGVVVGVATGDMGIAKNGSHKDTYMRGMALMANHTLLAEGAHGSLSKEIIERFGLREGRQAQTYGLGLKELWDVPPERHRAGRVIHTQGWPLDRVVGGGFIYDQENNQVAIGFVVALDYENPYLSPYEEFQRFKTHPAVKNILRGGRRVAYGARVINEGGLQSIPQLAFPGGALIGCAAGFVNVPRIKGSHNAMKSGMLAAEAAFAASQSPDPGAPDLASYEDALRRSWVYEDLHLVRNTRPALSKFGLFWGTLYSGLEMWINTLGLGFLIPWTFSHKPDHLSTIKADQCKRIEYEKPDGEITFDRLSSVFLSNTNHEEDQPVHLQLKNSDIPIEVNLAKFEAPEQRYCPAGVYEIVDRETGAPHLQINAQNCVHCKTCDIKDMTQNINWVVPEGGGGPNYPNM